METGSSSRGVFSLLASLALLGCATGGFEQLPAEEQALFRRCQQPLTEHLCRANGTECLAAQAETFAARRSSRIRRNWLVLNGCPASVMDAPEAPAAEAAVAAAPTAAPAKEEPAPAPAKVEVPPPPPPIEVPALQAIGGSCRRSADCESDLCVRGACVTLSALEAGKTCAAPVTEPAAEVAAAPAPVPELARAAPTPEVPLSKVRLGADAAAPQQLRETIVEHEADMKRCVERQLKLVPDLRAQGTLVLEVSAAGRVTQAALRGERLQGTALEGCVRALATRWVFPNKSRAYVVEAPLSVSGVP